MGGRFSSTIQLEIATRQASSSGTRTFGLMRVFEEDTPLASEGCLFRSLSGPAVASQREDPADRERDQEHDEEDIGDPCSAGGDAAEAEDGGHHCDEEKYERTVQQDRPPCMGWCCRRLCFAPRYLLVSIHWLSSAANLMRR